MSTAWRSCLCLSRLTCALCEPGLCCCLSNMISIKGTFHSLCHQSQGTVQSPALPVSCAAHPDANTWGGDLLNLVQGEAAPCLACSVGLSGHRLCFDFRLFSQTGLQKPPNLSLQGTDRMSQRHPTRAFASRLAMDSAQKHLVVDC